VVGSSAEGGKFTVDAAHNWWGTTVESEIQASIRDSDDNPACEGTVDYSRWLTEEAGLLTEEPSNGIHQNNIVGNTQYSIFIPTPDNVNLTPWGKIKAQFK
jgi:hypothetical protein